MVYINTFVYLISKFLAIIYIKLRPFMSQCDRRRTFVYTNNLVYLWVKYVERRQYTLPGGISSTGN